MTRLPRKTIAGCAVALMLCACSAPETQPAAQASDQPTPAAERPQTVPTAPGPGGQIKGKRAPGQEDEPLLAYRAFGNEPFWSVRTEGDILVFSTPEDQAGQRMRGSHAAADGGIRYAGEHAGKRFDLDIRPGECNDGMSDNRYVFTATFRYGDASYSGCAEQAMAKQGTP